MMVMLSMVGSAESGSPEIGAFFKRET